MRIFDKKMMKKKICLLQERVAKKVEEIFENGFLRHDRGPFSNLNSLKAQKLFPSPITLWFPTV